MQSRKEIKQNFIKVNNIAIDYYYDKIKDKKPTQTEIDIYDTLVEASMTARKKMESFEDYEKIIKKGTPKTRRNKNLKIIISKSALKTGHKDIFFDKFGNIFSTGKIRDEIIKKYVSYLRMNGFPPTFDEFLENWETKNKEALIEIVEEVESVKRNKIEFWTVQQQNQFIESFQTHDRTYNKIKKIVEFIYDFQYDNAMKHGIVEKPSYEIMEMNLNIPKHELVEIIHYLIRTEQLENKKNEYVFTNADVFNTFNNLEKDINKKIRKKNQQ